MDQPGGRRLGCSTSPEEPFMSDAGARSDKPKLTDRLKAKIEAARRRWPVFDHVMTMQEHYARVNGNVLAAGATYFGFLSFFPILALAFYVAGKVSDIYPDATDAVSEDRKSTRLNSSHVAISYAVFCLKKKKKLEQH